MHIAIAGISQGRCGFGSGRGYGVSMFSPSSLARTVLLSLESAGASGFLFSSTNPPPQRRQSRMEALSGRQYGRSPRVICCWASSLTHSEIADSLDQATITQRALVNSASMTSSNSPPHRMSGSHQTVQCRASSAVSTVRRDPGQALNNEENVGHAMNFH